MFTHISTRQRLPYLVFECTVDRFPLSPMFLFLQIWKITVANVVKANVSAIDRVKDYLCTQRQTFNFLKKRECFSLKFFFMIRFLTAKEEFA